MNGIQPGNIVTMIFQSIYTGVNNISVGVFGIPAQDMGLIVGAILVVILSIAVVTGIRRKNSFSLYAQKNS